MANNEPVVFEIKETGDITGEQWFGSFAAKQRLSYRDQLKRDQIRRDLLGTDAANATQLARSQAEIFSELAVRLTKAPSWWTEAGNGLDLTDDNVVLAVYRSAMKVEQDALEELKKKSEEAKKALAEKKG